MDSTRTDKPVITEPVRRLMEMDCEMISAKDIAPVVRMSESVIIHYAKTGQWDQEHLGKFVISGNRVKFFRRDFLVKCGFMEPEPEGDPTEEILKMLGSLLEGQITIMRALHLLLDNQMNEKAASCGNS